MKTFNTLSAASLMVLSFGCAKNLNSGSTAQGVIEESSSSTSGDYVAPRSFFITDPTVATMPIAPCVSTNTCNQSSPSPAPAPAPAPSPNPSTSGSLTEGPEDKMQVYVGRSRTGPWTLNGKACRGEASYIKLVNIPAGANIRGCAGVSPAEACLDYSKHREYLASEWSEGNIITVLSAADSINYPLGQYSFYNSLRAGKKLVIVQAGTATLETCAGVTPPQVTCNWQVTNPRPVVGGGVNHYPDKVCNQNGITGDGYYDMGGGRVEYFKYICECK